MNVFKKANDFFEYKIKRIINVNRLGLPVEDQNSALEHLGYLGWVGYDNYGDDVLYFVIKQLFSGARMDVADYYSLSELLHFKELVKRNMQRYILGGGTLIFRSQYIEPVEKLLADGKKLFCFGTGVADVGYWSSAQNNASYNHLISRWVDALAQFEYIGVRGPLSKQSLEAHGLSNVEIIGDPALAAGLDFPRNRRANNNKVIGVSLGAHDPIIGGQERINSILSGFLKEKEQAGYTIKFLQFSQIDRENAFYVAKTANLVNPEFIDYRGRVDYFSSHISACDFIIGERLHSMVLAAAYGVPFVAIGYQPKCVDFVKSIEYERSIIDLAELSVELIADKFNYLVENRTELSKHLFEQTAHYSSIQATRAKALLGN